MSRDQITLMIAVAGFLLALSDRMLKPAHDAAADIAALRKDHAAAIGSVRDRVLVLETKQLFLHGAFDIPPDAKTRPLQELER